MHAYLINKEASLEYQDAISKFTSKFVKDKTGKGPLNVNVKISEDNIDIVIVGYLTKYEKVIVEEYKLMDEVNNLRYAYFKAFEPEYIEKLEKIINKKISLLYYHIDLEKDTLILTFNIN